MLQQKTFENQLILCFVWLTIPALQLAGNVVYFAQHKFASNVIEKCLSCGDVRHRNMLISEVCGTQNEYVFGF